MSYLHAGSTPARKSILDLYRNLYNRLTSGGVEYQYFIDIWEGQGPIDWGLIEAAAAAIRINSISGGTHKDDLFDSYWAECPLLKTPYFVYNPWLTGLENFQWLSDNSPPGVTSVFLDIEVIKDGYPPRTYAEEVDTFFSLCESRWARCAIYTAQWFLPQLESWPERAGYWWAQYPKQFYPDQVERWNWQRLADEMEARGNPYPSNSASVPGDLVSWQFSGDRIVVPGCSRPMDLSVFYGSYQDLTDWIGGEVVEPPTGVKMYEFVSSTNQMSLRKGPSVLDEKITSYAPGTVFSGDFLQFYPVPLHEAFIGDFWLHVTEVQSAAVDGWVAVVHQGEKYGQVAVTDSPKGFEYPPEVTLSKDDTDSLSYVPKNPA